VQHAAAFANNRINFHQIIDLYKDRTVAIPGYSGFSASRDCIFWDPVKAFPPGESGAIERWFRTATSRRKNSIRRKDVTAQAFYR
jgi:hypothetical protein